MIFHGCKAEVRMEMNQNPWGKWLHLSYKMSQDIKDHLIILFGNWHLAWRALLPKLCEDTIAEKIRNTEEVNNWNHAVTE